MAYYDEWRFYIAQKNASMVQGRRKVRKSRGGASSNVVGEISPPVEIGLTDLQKNWEGGLPPAPPLATALLPKTPH